MWRIEHERIISAITFERKDRDLSAAAVVDDDVVKEQVCNVSGPTGRQCSCDGVSCRAVCNYGDPLVPRKRRRKWSYEIKADAVERTSWNVYRLKWAGRLQGRILAALEGLPTSNVPAHRAVKAWPEGPRPHTIVCARYSEVAGCWAIAELVEKSRTDGRRYYEQKLGTIGVGIAMVENIVMEHERILSWRDGSE